MGTRAAYISRPQASKILPSHSLQRNGQQSIDARTVADHDAFGKTEPVALLVHTIEVNAGREQVDPPVAHRGGDNERRLGGDRLAGTQQWHPHDMAIALPLVDVGLAQGRDAID